VRAADLMALTDDVERKKRAEDLAGYSKLLDADPANPLRHDQVAMIHLGSGKVDLAVGHLRDSLRLNPESAPTHYNFGIALSLQRRFDEALAEFREAIRLDPSHADAHNNAGAMLHVAGRLDEAETHYRRAVAIQPDNADARSNLGRLLAATGRDRFAAEQFRAAVGLRPDHVSALAGLGWVLATTRVPDLGTPDEAVRAAEMAVTLTQGGDPAALDALAAAYAASGDFDRAVATVEKALMAAYRTGGSSEPTVDPVRGRLDLYRRRQPFLR
jgi:Flp pilus assembly protein TadD